MSIHVSNGTTTIKPDAWKWYLGAAISAIAAMNVSEYAWIFGIFTIVSIACGSGHLSWTQLDRRGLKVKTLFKIKQYAWDEITDFRLMKIKSGFVTASTMVSFTKVSQEGSIYAKAAKFVSGGTQSVPVHGIKAKTLITLMAAYQQGVILNDEIIAKILGNSKFTRGGGMPTHSADIPDRTQPARQPAGGGDMEAADMAMRRAAAEQRNGKAPTYSAPKNSPRGGFGKAKPVVTPRPKFGKASGSSPLIQDSGSRRRHIGK